ncbi:MAG: DUF2807 domain-containing protein [Cyclobacteriaceae bacterium]|nr:DUF2807 domain-containing protein [Cyclobacteriaceae bacterium]
MKRASLTLFTALILFPLAKSIAQGEAQSLEHFDRIMASQFVKVVLQQGEAESIRFDYSDIDPAVVNVKVKRKRLLIYLDDARLVGKRQKYYYNGQKHSVSRYGHRYVTAYVTYKNLRGIEIRGEKGVECESAIVSDKFKLKVYGENEVSLASLKTEKFKASIFGINHVKINGGSVEHQVYRLFGENEIDTQKLSSNTAVSRLYGEGTLTLNAQDELKISAFGEPEIRLDGPAHINKNIILGAANIKVRRLN